MFRWRPTKLKRVSAAVTVESKKQQEPWTEGSIVGEFYFKAGAAAVKPELVTAMRRSNSKAGRRRRAAIRLRATRPTVSVWARHLESVLPIEDDRVH